MTDDPIRDALTARADEHEAAFHHRSDDSSGDSSPFVLPLAAERSNGRRTHLGVVAAAVLAVAGVGVGLGVLLADRAGDAPVSTGPAVAASDEVEAPATTGPSASLGESDDGQRVRATVLVANGSGLCGVAGNFADAIRASQYAADLGLDVVDPANADLTSSTTVFTTELGADHADEVASLIEPKPPVERLTDDVLRSAVPGWVGEMPTIVVILGQDQGAAWGGCDGIHSGAATVTPPSPE